MIKKYSDSRVAEDKQRASKNYKVISSLNNVARAIELRKQESAMTNYLHNLEKEG